MNKPLQEEVFINIAREISRLSRCRTQTGCVLVRSDGSIAACCPNGELPGLTLSSHNDKQNEYLPHSPYAEQNALASCWGELNIAYLTHEPCEASYNMLVERGVRFVVFVDGDPELCEKELSVKSWILPSLSMV